jgi:hypothetical protein
MFCGVSPEILSAKALLIDTKTDPEVAVDDPRTHCTPAMRGHFSGLWGFGGRVE